MMPEFCSVRHVIARKRHRCTECRGWIEPGDVYERAAGRWDGGFSTFKTCIECEQARDFYVEDLGSREFRDLDEGHYCFTMVAQDLLDEAPEIPIGDGRRFRAYRHVIEMRRRGETASVGGR